MTTRTHEQGIAYKEFFIVGVLVALALAFLPFLAVIGLALQFAFVIVCPVILIAGLVYAITRPAER